MDGKRVESVNSQGADYVGLSQIGSVLGFEPGESGDGAVSLTWRKQPVTLTTGGSECRYGDRSGTLSAPALRYHDEVWVPVEDFCKLLEISVFVDEESGIRYCTPGAGDWALPEGYRVPVLMYHGVSDNPWTMPSLFVTPAEMEAHLQYLQDNGYTPIWFEDLWHVQDFEKPVILTFDDGYVDNYTTLLPILEKYNAKATCFIITDFLNHDPSIYANVDQYVTWDMVKAMSESGYISIQSHTMNHWDLNEFMRSSQEKELYGSYLNLIRETGKEPFVLAYPEGQADGNTFELTAEIYRFGLKMSGPIYVTGDDPTLVYRVYIPRGMSMEEYARQLAA